MGFPDLRNASSTLEELGWFNIEIRSIRIHLFSSIVGLKKLLMGRSVHEQIGKDQEAANYKPKE